MGAVMIFTLGILYLGLIAAGSAAGTALVLGRRRTVAVAAVVGLCLVAGITAVMS